MRFIWLDINSSYSHSSLAIPLLDAQLESNQRDKAIWEVVSGTLSANYYDIIEKLLSQKPDVIFSTIWLFNSQ
ncbi:MAG: B12-binding domain-containing radical SAM protein, partial [Bacteroidales bacterium]